MKIILTGATGFIGSSVFRELKKKGQDITTYGRKNCDHFLDLSSFKIKQNKIHSAEVLIHCAGVTDEEIKIDFKQAIHRNTQGLVQLVDWAKKVGIEHFIYISSAHVYGDLNRKIDENSGVYPKSLYANLHLFAENYIRAVFKNVTIIRPNAVYGNIPLNFNRWGLIPFSFPRDLAKTNKIIIRSHGKQHRNFVSVEAIANIVYDVSVESVVGVINSVGYKTMSVKDFAYYCVDTIKDKYNIEFLVEILSKEDYINNFEYTSIRDQYQEHPDELRKHILTLFNKENK